MIFLIISALIVLSVLVLVHELGHFLAAKKVGVLVEEFGIGFPPRVWGKKMGETIYSVNLLPIGGFVKLHGETADMPVKEPKRAFINQSKSARAFVAVAGVLMNWALAAVCFSIVFWITGVATGVKVVEVVEGSPAQEVGIQEGDIITSLGRNNTILADTFFAVIGANEGRTTSLTLERAQEGGNFEKKSLNVNIRSSEFADEGLLGVVYTANDLKSPPLWQKPFVYFYWGVVKTWVYTKLIFLGVLDLFSQLITGHRPDGVAGPVAVGGLIAETARIGIVPLLELMAIISINLAILNLVPFPPLDGSRLVFLWLEGIFGRKHLPKVEYWMHTFGMGVLLLLMIVITASEIPKLIAADSLSGFVESVLTQ